MTPDAIRKRASRAAVANQLSNVYGIRVTNRTLDKIIADLEARPHVRDANLTPEQFDAAIAQAMADIIEAHCCKL